MPADERPSRSADLTAQEWVALLTRGSVKVVGRLPWSSNATFLVTVTDGDRTVRAVYKPGAGERGLWDFPDGLFRREVAAYELDRALGLEIVPTTVLRAEAPLGEGSLQRFIEADFTEHYFSLREVAEHGEALRVIAGFDLLANNADRKGGHLLVDRSGHLWAIDNGLSFHADTKLRTVMWDFAGEELPASIVAGARLFTAAIPDELVALLSAEEVDALAARAEAIIDDPRFPGPTAKTRLPWPLV
ncbi:MAG TPA: SCO1664 family protein [Acidimicrobiales bacterium]|nr:SCO1664 family protein [Acidimicrobiales bacterium]